jgi:hypothetical protein
MTSFAELSIEETALEWLKDMGYTTALGNDSVPDMLVAKLMRSGIHVKEMEKEL